MTVVRIGEQGHMGANNRPDWCELVGLGMFRMGPDSRFDRHFHDSPEYWLFYKGQGKVSVGDETYYVQAGDVVATPAGSAHDIIEIYEDLEGFYFEEKVPEGGRIGHLYEDPSHADGHQVPLVPLPDDFPPLSRAGINIH